jgi:hypothetical protein
MSCEIEYCKYNVRQTRYFERNGKRSYYSFDNELYSITFPELWAISHHPKTGPNNCQTCKNIGCWNGVFLGYCDHCAIFIYKGMRGKGLICYGIEMDFVSFPDAQSIYSTYMKDVSLDDIGDPEMYDTRKIHYPSTEPNEIPTIEKYVGYNVTYVSPETSESESESVSTKENSSWDFSDSTSDSDCCDCFGMSSYQYGSNYDGGYDSF